MRSLARAIFVWIHVVGCILGVILAIRGFGEWKDTGFKIEPKHSMETEGRGAAYVFVLGLGLTGYCLFSPIIARAIYSSNDPKQDDDLT